MNFDQARFSRDDEYEPLLSEKDSTTVEVDSEGVLPDDLTRDELTLPALSEPQLARHYTRLSQMNYSVELGPYPLGSCTMKYNPSFTEDVAADLHGRCHLAVVDGEGGQGDHNEGDIYVIPGDSISL